MMTPWGAQLDRDHVLPEYPRPQLQRDSYLNLNGPWQYAITGSDDPPAAWDGEILVPFSPESELSGVGRQLLPGQTLWYRRTVTLPPGFIAGRVLLHFGAVDQQATVFVNGTEVCTHLGGYTPFSVEITDHLQEKNTLLVRVHDDSDSSFQARGKQKLHRGGIWYTAQSGIWQTVWMESVPGEYIQALRITPLFDESAVEITVTAQGSFPCRATVGEASVAFRSNEPARLALPQFVPWTPERPHLYDLTVTMGADTVRSYFGMRKFAVATDGAGVRRLFLNNRPYFQLGLLDQGYYSDGLYTAPSDEAMIHDIQTAKDLGFNLLRKHIKIEPLRWYYHCDRLGMLVWQDMVNGGGAYPFLTVCAPLVTGIHLSDRHYAWFGRADARGREQYTRELDATVRHLYNTVSLALWVPFNEGWGQFDAGAAVERIWQLDTTRPVDHASGWHDQWIGDLRSLHVYFRPYRFRPDRLGRAVALSECGGYNLRVPGHCFGEKDVGYRPCRSPEELLAAYRQLVLEQLVPAARQGLCAVVYTQLTDVEDELNGFLTYDRRVLKLPAEQVRALNLQLRQAADGRPD